MTAKDYILENYGIERTSLDGAVKSTRVPDFSLEKWFKIMEEYAEIYHKEKQDLKTSHCVGK